MDPLQAPPLLQLSPEQRGYQPGDNVTWGGTAGKVLFVRKSAVYVKFINHIVQSFMSDGRYLDWHKESSLVPCSEEELKRQAEEFYNGRKNR